MLLPAGVVYPGWPDEMTTLPKETLRYKQNNNMQEMSECLEIQKRPEP